MRKVTFAAAQFACSSDREANVAKAKHAVREAAGQGANVVLVQELFESLYFCQDQDAAHYALAAPFEHNPLVAEMAALAQRAGRRAAGQFLRACGPSLFQFACHDRCRWQRARAIPKIAYSCRSRLPGEVLFHAGRYGLQSLANPLRQTRRGHLLGPMVSRSRARDGVEGAEALFYPTAIGSEPRPRRRSTAAITGGA